MTVAVAGPRQLAEPKDEIALLTNAAAGAAREGRLRVLEAGCGKRWLLKPDGVQLHLTGVDTDAAAMRIRMDKQHDLDEPILGDLRTVDLPSEAFDIAYCSFVLEHVSGAEDVLDRLLAAVRPGGRLLVRVPDGDSVFGFLVKHSPHRVHVWYKRFIERKPNAGKPGYAPYPTVYDEVVSTRGMRDWADRRGLRIVDEYATNFYLRVFGVLAKPVEYVLRGVAAVSRGRLTAAHNNIGFVIVKP